MNGDTAAGPAVFGAQIQGERPYQEDAFDTLVVDELRGPFIAALADGMGGHAAGDVAAELAVTTFFDRLRSVLTAGSSSVPLFEDACLAANEAIGAHSSAHPDTSGMGTTFIGVELLDHGVRWISVGDSIVYLVGAQEIERVNADHSMAPRLDAAARRGEISFAEAAASPSRSALISAVTGDEISRIDFPAQPRPMAADDWLVVASDGLDTLGAAEVARIVREAGHKGDAQAVCKSLLDTITEVARPNQDNTTVIALRKPSLASIQESNAGVSSPETASDQVITRPIPNR
ncbi:MAG: protein phosphatase 2C domain-containing protein [Pseudomonadota bacterium]